jgi:hypothetical protein
MTYKNYNTETMTPDQLWQAVQTPIEDKMPENLKAFLKCCERAFFDRKIKLYPIPGRTVKANPVQLKEIGY